MRHPTLRLHRSPDFTVMGCIQHVLLVLVAVAIVGVGFRDGLALLEQLASAIDRTIIVLAGLGAVGLAAWKQEDIVRYISWRLQPRMQEVTFQYLAYATFVATSYIGLVAAGIVDSEYISVAFACSAGLLILTNLYVIAGYLVTPSPTLSEIMPPPLSILSDVPQAHMPIESQVPALNALVTLLSGASKQDGEALAVALDGAWGDGKSSIVKMALEWLDDDPYVVVPFEPWRYTTQEALVNGFYTEIGRAIEAQLPGFQMSRFDLVKFAQNFITNVDKTGTFRALFGAYKRGPERYAAKANAHLQRHNKKLLLILDDVDRLHDDSHVMRTLQLAQYLKGDIERSVIIFIAEMERVKNAIPERLRVGYLQKFFDTTITVIPPSEQELVNFINDKLQLLELKNDVRLEADKQLLLLLRNIRGVNRVLSMLAVDLRGVGNNVHAQDVFFMRAIYYAYPVLYADIKNNPTMYYAYKASLQQRDFGIYGFSDERFVADQVQHFTLLLDGLNLLPSERRRLQSLLEDYFPYLKNVFKEQHAGKTYIDERKLAKGRRIGAREYLDRYFMFSEHTDKRHATEEGIRRFVGGAYKKTADDKRTQLLKRLYEDHSKEEPQLFFAALTSIIQDQEPDVEEVRVSLLRDMLRVYLWATGYLVHDDNGSLIGLLSTINEYAPQGSYDAIFGNAETYMAHPSAGLRLLLYMHPLRDNHLNNLRAYAGYAALRKKILRKVDQFYLEGDNDIFAEDASDQREWRFMLFQWATSVCNDTLTELVASRKDKVNRYIAGLVRDSVPRLHEFIMGAFWQNDLVGDKYRFVFNNKTQAYDSGRFVGFVQHALTDPDTTLTDEQRSDFERFLTQYSVFRKHQKDKKTAT